MQEISKQIERLEGILDGLYNRSQSMLGDSDPITSQSVKAILSLSGLKYDYEELKRIEEETKMEQEEKE